jgi:Sulfotransferase domain
MTSYQLAGSGVSPDIELFLKERLWAVRETFGTATSSFRMEPDFLIIGAQRAGTTSLHSYLKQHPAVIPSWLVRKELHYFSKNFDKSYAWYKGHFPLRLRASWVERESGVTPLTGEASPYYLFHPLSPSRVASRLPEAKLLVLLRDPVQRAYSHYRKEVAFGFEPLSFPEAIAKESSRLAGEAERMLADPNYEGFNHRHYSYVSRGIYVDQLVRWSAFFPSDRLLILSSESFFTHPSTEMQRVFEFLGLPSYFSTNYAKHNESRTSMELDRATEKHLTDLFRPHNERLFEHLGTEFPWSA